MLPHSLYSFVYRTRPSRSILMTGDLSTQRSWQWWCRGLRDSNFYWYKSLEINFFYVLMKYLCEFKHKSITFISLFWLTNCSDTSPVNSCALREHPTKWLPAFTIWTSHRSTPLPHIPVSVPFNSTSPPSFSCKVEGSFPSNINPMRKLTRINICPSPSGPSCHQKNNIMFFII